MGLFDFVGDMFTKKNDYNAEAVALPGEAERQARFAQAIQQAQSRGAIQMDPSQQAQFRDGQTGLVNTLQAQAAGQGPSVAGAQYQQAADKNAAMQSALANSGHGNAGMAARIAAQNTMAGNQSAAQGAAVGRMQEQLSAQSQLGQALAQGRSQDIGFANSQADLGLRSRALNDQTAQNYEQMGLGAANAQMNAGLQAQQINAGVATGNNATQNKAIGGFLSGAAGMLMPKAPSPPGGAGGAESAAMLAAASGGVVPGHAPVHGDSPENDMIPTMLSPEEIVVPRSVATRPDFIKHLSKYPEMQKHAPGFGSVLAARASLKGGK